MKPLNSTYPLAVVLVGDVGTQLHGTPSADGLANLIIQTCPDGKRALRLFAAESAQVWFVAIALPDMSGFDCVDMLAEVCSECRFFLVAEQYDAIDEVRATRLPRTRYLCGRITHELLRALIPQSVTTPDPPAYEAGNHNSFASSGRSPP